MAAARIPFAITAHKYASPVRGACAYELGPSTSENAIIFIGGLFDGPHTVPYTRVLAKTVEEAADLDYSVFEFRLRSSFTGFGTSSLKNDVEDTGALVKYLRSIGRKKIILFGHSTGCQVCAFACVQRCTWLMGDTIGLYGIQQL